MAEWDKGEVSQSAGVSQGEISHNSELFSKLNNSNGGHLA